jgi:hypothetical protein
MKTLNIYQAALALRTAFAHTGIELGYAGEDEVNTYFIHHDAMHYYTGLEPKEVDEPLALAAELVLGGQDYNAIITVDAQELSKVLANIPAEVVEELIGFYTDWYNNY